ncbi:nucleotide-binding protein [Peribacillus simplex]|nr:nucleotide-binding protein [Peribacillus simplex]
MYELDKTNIDEVLDEIIIPYIKHEDFQFDGYFLKPEDIERVVIKETSQSTRDLSKYENDHMDPGLLMYISPEDIVDLDKYTKDVTKKLFALAKERLETGGYELILKKELEIDRTKVFIVHGHDDLAKIEVARFIEKMGLNPIILHEQASGGKTIIEKIEAYSNVGFGVVLYTPCDVGTKKGNEANLQPRARQNVVFEHGFLIGKIGRHNVTALVKEKVETPNDISGVVYINMDPHYAWQFGLAKELKSSGYDIDMNRI